MIQANELRIGNYFKGVPYTFGTDYDTYLRIGGHDLFEEFESYYGKWCVLKINLKS